MDSITILAASGLRARSEALDLIAHNMANASTPGFKADRELYREYAAEAESGPSPNIEGRWTDFAQGPLTPTGSQTDFAIAGKGFFSAQGPNGALFTRAGAFRVSTAGRMTTPEGYEVATRNAQGQPVRIDPRQDFQVARDGTITQGGVPLGRLMVFEMATAGYEKIPGNYFSWSSPQPIEARGAEVHQGSLEQSNAASAESAVRLVNVMRQFEMLNRAVALNGEMSRRAIEDVARPTA